MALPDIMIFSEELNKKNWHYIEAAVEQARLSTCKRSRCGSVIVAADRIIGRGFNSPPGNDPANARCGLSHTLKPGFNSDRTCCIHAEQRAIMDALRFESGLFGCRLYFARIDDSGNLIPSRLPRCTICSKMSLDVGLSYFSMVRAYGSDLRITMYKTKKFNELSYEFDGHDK